MSTKNQQSLPKKNDLVLPKGSSTASVINYAQKPQNTPSKPAALHKTPAAKLLAVAPQSATSHYNELPTVIAHGGHQITFFYTNGQWLAEVKEKLAVGYRNLLLPVHGTLDVNMEKVFNSSPEWQKTHIYLCGTSTVPASALGPYVYIRPKILRAETIQVNIQKSLANLSLAHYLTAFERLPSEQIKKWHKMAQQITTLCQELPFQFNTTAIHPNPNHIVSKLEAILEQHGGQKVTLDNYVVAYNQLVHKIQQKIKRVYYDAPNALTDNIGNYLVIIQIDVKNMDGILYGPNKKSTKTPDAVMHFDLAQLVKNLNILVFSKESYPSTVESLPKNLTPFLEAYAKEDVKMSALIPEKEKASNNTFEYLVPPAEYLSLPESSVLPTLASTEAYLDEYDLPTSMHVPHAVQLNAGNVVKITFGHSIQYPSNRIISADRLVDQRLIPTLIQALNAANEIVKIESIHISSTTNGHDGHQFCSSNHRKENGARAIDISQINGQSIVALGANHPLVIALQNALEHTSMIRENFGPYFRHKQRKDYSNSKLNAMHRNHIHFSIDR